MKTIYLDTETTGIDESDKIIQLAYMVEEENKEMEIFDTLCSTDIEISYKAMATHHLTPEMLEGKPVLTKTDEYKFLEKLNTNENYVVIHNAPFDIGMLRKEGFENKMKIIDTHIVVQHLLPDVESHALQYLRYSQGLYRLEKDIEEKFDVKLQAHDALSDILMLYNLFNYLRKDFTIEELYELSNKKVLVKRMKFGKYRGENVQTIAAKDSRYLLWLLNNSDNLDDNLRYTIEFYLKPDGF